MIRTFRYIPTLLILSLLIYGCRSQAPVSISQGSIPSLPSSTAATDELFLQMVDSYSDWTDFYSPVTLRLESPKSMSISGRATMVSGKEIYISLRMLGMEIAVIYIDENKIYAIDKFHKQFIEEDLKELLSDVDITIKDVQNILLGHLTSLGKGTVDRNDVHEFTFLSADDQWILTPEKQIKGTSLNFIATKTEPPLLTDISLRIKGKGVFGCKYSDITVTPAGATAALLTLHAPMGTGDVKASLEWDIQDAKWNEGRTPKFKMPSSSYKRIDTKSLLQSIGNNY